jgi:hypothetical protein
VIVVRGLSEQVFYYCMLRFAIVITVDHISNQVVKDYFLKGEYTIRWTCTENDQMWADIRSRGLDEYGIRSARLWKPNPFLLQVRETETKTKRERERERSEKR